MGRKGRKGQGTNNPLLLRKLKAQSRPQVKGTTIKDYLSRPRPTLDEIHKIMKERDAKNLQLERWETEMGRDWRATLDENRAQVLKERAEKAKQEKKQVKEARREEKRLAKLKRRLRKGKLTDDEARDYRRSKRQFKKRLGEMQLSQWLNQADDSEDEKRAEAERRREEGGGEGQDGEEPPLKRPKVAWVFKDNATQTQWKKEKENGHVVQETNPAPVPVPHADGEAREEQGDASGGQLPPGMQTPHMPAMALLQQNSHLQIQMLQQQIVKLQEVLAAQPLLQLEQRAQMQRQIVMLQQQVQMHLQRPPHMPFMLGSPPFANPFANAASTSSAALFARASALSLAMRAPNRPPAPLQAPPALSSASVAGTSLPAPAPAATNSTPAPAPAADTEGQPRLGRAKRVFATTQEASQGTQPPAATQE